MTRQRLISTTLVGTGRAAETVDALQSAAALVDGFIVIDTSPTDDASAATWFATRLPARSIFARFPWPGRFDVARNESLRLAAEVKADWSVFLDSDERIICPDPEAVRAWLAALDPKVRIVCAFAADGTYQRERFLRGDIPQRWKFRTHESIDAGPGEQAVIPANLISWAELPKTGGMVVEKSKRDVALIREDLKEFPDEPRLWFYLGNSLAHVGPEHYDEAIAAYRKVAEVGIGEGCAWACFCAARLYFEQSRRASERMQAATGDDAAVSREREEMWRLAYKALDCCSAGIHRKVSVAELHWLAACIHHAIGNHKDGLAYARQAALYGHGSMFFEDRHGFMVPHALKEGPSVVEAMCLASVKSGEAPVLPPVGVALAGALSAATGKMGKAEPRPRVEYVRGPVHVTVTSTGFRVPPETVGRCINSVTRQMLDGKHVEHHYVAADRDTYVAALHAPGTNPGARVTHGDGLPLLANLLPIWRSLPPEEVIIWLDGDDWLATDRAIARVADAHSRGMLATYGSFMYADGRMGFAGQCGDDPRGEPWRATHLKSFRAGLVQRVAEGDWRWPDGKYLDLAIDRAVMLPVLEMAGRERAEYIPEILCVYNEGHGFYANASEAERVREAEATRLVHGRRRYERIGAL